MTGGKREGEEECSRALSCLQLLLGNLHLMTTMRKQNTYQIICNKFHTHTDSTHTLYTHTHILYTHAQLHRRPCQAVSYQSRGRLFGQGCHAMMPPALPFGVVTVRQRDISPVHFHGATSSHSTSCTSTRLARITNVCKSLDVAITSAIFDFIKRDCSDDVVVVDSHSTPVRSLGPSLCASHLHRDQCRAISDRLSRSGNKSFCRLS